MDADKLAAQKLWNTTPCGTGEFLAGLDYATLEWFDAVRRERYEVADRWMPRVIDFEVARGKKLLEIGHGIGTDLLEFRRHGADVSGIDITEEHHRLARRNFELHGEPVTLKLCDSAAIAFPDASFDVVYSHGVLHHTPDTVRCISEAYRVLKPGGLFILGLYRTLSAFHLFGMIARGAVNGQLARLGYRKWMSTLERGADGVERAPLVKTYRESELRAILGDFAHVDFKVAHFVLEHVPLARRFVPRAVERPLEPLLGWYIVAFARK